MPNVRAARKKVTKKTPKKTTKKVAKKTPKRVPKKTTKKPTAKRSTKVAKKTPKKKRDTTNIRERVKAKITGYKKEKAHSEDAYYRSLEQQRRYLQKRTMGNRDIAPLPLDTIDWELRNSCKYDFKRFCETYGQTVFFLDWSEPQLGCILKAEAVCLNSGTKHAFAMPRGGGKTALSRMAVIWATAYAHKRYVVFIGSREDAAVQTLDFIKRYWFANALLLRDFPEIAYPIVCIENRYHLAKGQLFDGENTSIQWASDTVRYPSILLPENAVETYKSNDEDSVIWIPQIRRYMTASSGIKIDCAGIDGAVRGKAEVHPLTLEQMRPDLALLDDVQKDQKAESPVSCEKMILLIDGAIKGLPGPEEGLSALMPCTVIREGDVSDTYLTPGKKPEWQGQRTRMVTSWPPGVTDHEVTMEYEPSQRWNEYDEIRKKSLRLKGNITLATDYYRKHRKVMDKDFHVTWTDRFIKEGENQEISAQQNAMNLRLENPVTFPSEYQNIGRVEAKNLVQMITAEQLRQRTIHVPKLSVTLDTQYISTFIDIQDEILFYATLAVSPDFTGVFTDYGTWPHVTSRQFTKNQTQGWNLLSREFFKAYPSYKDKALTVRGGKPKAPLDEKIRYALEQCVSELQAKRYIKDDGNQTELSCHKYAIDARWGQASDTIQRYIRENNDPNVMSYFGFSVSPVNKQLEEYTRTGQYRSWLFEDQVSPKVEKVKWVMRPGKDGRPYMFADVDVLKDFLMARLAVAPGSRGSISLYHDIPDNHSLFSNHICSSEYPEPIEGRGIKKNKWLVRDGRPDNDWLDCAVGCIALCSLQGAFIRHGKDAAPQKIKRSLSKMYSRKNTH